MIYLNKNSSTPAPKKIDLENSLQQSFATLSKLHISRYVCIYVQLLPEGRG